MNQKQLDGIKAHPTFADIRPLIVEIERLREELMQIRDDGPEDDTKESLLAFAHLLQRRARKALEAE